MMSSKAEENRARFKDFYKHKLGLLQEAKPEEYVWAGFMLDTVVDKMMIAFARGGATVGPAAKWAASMCGISGTARGIKEYLNADDEG